MGITELTIAPPATGKCVDCGAPTGGLRCKKCHGRELARLALAETAVRDEQVLRLREVDGLTYERIGIRLGITKARAWQLYRQANARRTRRDPVGFP